MDSDFWRTRLAAAKRQFNMQNHHHFSNSQLDRINLDDFEIEEEVRPDYPCPYCYEEFDVASLCSHLEDEHSCESKAILALKELSQDIYPCRDLREAHLQVLLGGSGYRSNGATSSAAATDNFLSSLVLNFSSEADEISKSVLSSLEESSSRSVASEHMWKSSFHSALSREEREERMRQAAGRSIFVQDLLISTLLAE
ncbi:UNVERIFIED_CONTAM: protein dehydration-induced [Sesamum radiatum]|uniref:Protein dehydration-induced n=1 Tax=Sesamum radiatum TaxID=300843 RepID=A0AAW2T4D7_SESRA